MDALVNAAYMPLSGETATVDEVDILAVVDMDKEAFMDK